MGNLERDRIRDKVGGGGCWGRETGEAMEVVLDGILRD